MTIHQFKPRLTAADLDARIAEKYSRPYRSERHAALDAVYPPDGCPTVRRFSRTMAEAFPDVRAPAVERPRRWPRIDAYTVAHVVVCIAGIGLVLALLTGVMR